MAPGKSEREEYETLKERLAKFGLEIAEDKTRILPFGRNSKDRDTFDFLGFTHVNSKTRNGQYTVAEPYALCESTP